MVDYYISPTGEGAKSGLDFGNASTLDQLDAILAKAQAGDRVLIVADKGDYTISKAITLTHGGSDAGAIAIKGVSSSGADMAATFVSNRAETYSPTAVQGQEVFKLLDGASHLSFENMAFQDVNTVFRLGGKLEDISIAHMTADNLNRFVYNLVSGTATDATVSGLTIKDVDVTGFAKAVVSLRYDTNNVLIEDVNGDSQHVDKSNFATGVQLEGTVHAVVVKDTKMGNITDTVNAYWNGDGFAAEGGVYDLAFINTHAYNNTDAGYDLKSKSTTLINAVAEGNTRNFRFWANDTVLENVTGIDPAYHGGISTSPSNVWLGANAKVTIKNSEFTDATGKAALFDLKNNGAILTIDNIVTNQTDAADILKGASATLIGLLNGSGSGPVTPPVVEPKPPVVEPKPPVVEPKPPVVEPKPPAVEPKPVEPAKDGAINGTDSNNTLTGGAANDIINGREGKDVITSGAGNDTLDGGRHEDSLDAGEGNDLVYGGINADTIAGAAGDDRVYGDLATLTAGILGGNDNVYGGDGADVIFGDAGTMTGAEGGKDYLYGGAGNDVIYGDAQSLTGSKGGNDALKGDDGNDTLYGDGATSSASAGGNDTLYGGKGDDVLTGGGGNDLFIVEGKGFGNDIITDFMGNTDKIDVSQMKVSFADMNIKVVGTDTVITFATGDSITVKNFTGLTKADIIAASTTEKSGSTPTTPTTPTTPATPTATTGEVKATEGADVVHGTSAADRIYGLGGNDQLYGGAGNDVLYGRNDNDTLYGEAGADNIMGDAGNDVLIGGIGNDIMNGGAGADRFIFGLGDGKDTISGFGSDDFVDFSGTGLKLADIGIVDTNDGLLLRYGADSVLLKDVHSVDTNDFIFG